MSILYTPKFKSGTIGVFFGGFAPFHLGHFKQVMRAKRENDACIIVVSGYDNDRGESVGLNFMDRFRYLREIFADDEQVAIALLNENNLPKYPLGWNEWIMELKNCIKNALETEAAYKSSKLRIYIGEKDYIEKLQQAFPLAEIRYTPRDKFTISATSIRKNPIKYWQYIMKPFQKEFTFKVLVAGTASGGKTHLVRDLSKSFQTSCAMEFAREYEEAHNKRDEELGLYDFQHLFLQQYEAVENALRSNGNCGIVFADTDGIVTELYAEEYLSKEEQAQIKEFSESIIKKYHWDLVLIVPPVTQYIDDNFRDMSQSEAEKRWKMHEILIAKYQKYGYSEKIHVLDVDLTNTMKEGFYERYQLAREIIIKEIKEKYQHTFL